VLVGSDDGFADGVLEVGSADGVLVGSDDGIDDGVLVGSDDGFANGEFVGSDDGINDGVLEVGSADGMLVGSADGSDDGSGEKVDEIPPFFGSRQSKPFEPHSQLSLLMHELIQQSPPS
jgi:hypothetical protein